GPRQAIADGGNGSIEDVRDLLEGESLVVIQDENLLEVGVDAAQGPGGLVTCFDASALDAGSRGADKACEGLSDALTSVALAEQVVRRVGCDSVQPGTKRGVSLEALEGIEGACEDGLEDVVVLGVIPEESVQMRA